MKQADERVTKVSIIQKNCSSGTKIRAQFRNGNATESMQQQMTLTLQVHQEYKPITQI
jgi:hypothetical protein